MEAISRRKALGMLGLTAGALAVTGCTPVKVVLRWYPVEFDEDIDRVKRVLAAFVDAVVPGVGPRQNDPTRHLFDPRFPLHLHTGYLAADLCRRARDCLGSPAFEFLSGEERAQVITEGLGADPTTARLYAGAIYLTQISSYVGIYDDSDGCPTIGWEGRYRPRSWTDLTYPRADEFLANELGVRGNFA